MRLGALMESFGLITGPGFPATTLARIFSMRLTFQYSVSNLNCWKHQFQGFLGLYSCSSPAAVARLCSVLPRLLIRSMCSNRPRLSAM